MKIYIPSNGKVGIYSVDLRMPTIGDLRKSSQFSSISEIKKTQFVKLLAEQPEAIDRITIKDRDYLFVIAVCALSMNIVRYTVKCPDDSSAIKVDLSLDAIEPVFLDTDVSLTKNILGREYNFKLLTVQDEYDCIDYANRGESEDYDDRLEDAYVCAGLGWEVNDSNIERVRELDMSVYYASQFFQLCCPHGMVLTKDVICPKCGKQIVSVLDITGDMLKVNMALIMERFSGIAGKIDFQSFNDMTLPEYNALIDALNVKASHGRR
nr:MAG TPA: baseplate protein [Caudoviricetes sp.]